MQVKLVIKVGQVVNVRHGSAQLTDLVCGDTTVVSINARTGAFTLANGMTFHSDGRGFSRNNACSVGPAICVHNDRTLPYDVRNAAYKVYRHQVNPDEQVEDLEL